MITCLVVYVWAVSANMFGLFGGMPGLDKLFNPKSELASEVYSVDGVLLGKYFRENRTPAQFSELSPHLIHALLATEDIRFENHSGIDFFGTIAIPFYLAIGKKRGSSTISQQLAKNLFDTRSDAYEGPLTKIPGVGKAIIKTKEWITAIKLERGYTKEEILTMYFNTVDFGSNAYGINTAARTFFGKAPAKLTIPEAALLVGILKGQTVYSPILKPAAALARRNTVLDQMEKYGFLSSTLTDSMKVQPIDLSHYKVESHNDGIAPYFRAELRKDLIAFCKERNIDLFSDGLRVYTTVNSRLQRYAEAGMARHMRYLQKEFFKYWRKRNPWADEDGKQIPNFIQHALERSPGFRGVLAQFDGNRDSTMALMRRRIPRSFFSWDGEFRTSASAIDSLRYAKHYLHAGLISMDPSSGAIRAWVGGINFKYFKYDHVRQGKRQPGSAFKPFVYTTALDNGYSPCYELVDAPVSIYLPETNMYWEPKNSDGHFTGEKVTLRQAMARSINSVAAQLIEKVGVPRVVEYAKRLGITSELDPVPALALGTSDVSLYEMVGAYGAFVNKGNWTKPWYISRIEDKHGNVLQEFNPERRQAISEETAYMMVHMLRGSTQERNGTALGLYHLGNTLPGNEVGGKTGTTSNYSDGWFMGITHDLVTGVWVGGDDRSIHFRSFNMGQGSKMALPIWSYYMDAAYGDPGSGVRKGRFERPKNFSVILDCKQWKQGPAADSATEGQELKRDKPAYNEE
jgi:penicillin-binding protein 1A